ncbi:MAG: 50S ribosomal protein L35 [Patescibacteria group bacterium]
MGKMKTTQAVNKRIKITKNKKVIARRSGQDHFNTRDTGKQVRLKRSDIQMSKTVNKLLKQAMPYN